MPKLKLTPEEMEHERRLAKIAKEGSIREFVEALSEHPVDGRLLRAFAAEEQAPEHTAFMQRLQEALKS